MEACMFDGTGGTDMQRPHSVSGYRPLRLRVGDVSKLVGLHEWADVPTLITELIYQKSSGRQLKRWDEARLGLRFVSEKEEVAVSLQSASKNVKRALAKAQAAKPSDVGAASKALESVHTALALDVGLAEDTKEQLKKHARHAVFTSFGTDHEDRALELYEHATGFAVTMANEKKFEWHFPLDRKFVVKPNYLQRNRKDKSGIQGAGSGGGKVASAEEEEEEGEEGEGGKRGRRTGLPSCENEEQKQAAACFFTVDQLPLAFNDSTRAELVRFVGRLFGDRPRPTATPTTPADAASSLPPSPPPPPSLLPSSASSASSAPCALVSSRELPQSAACSMACTDPDKDFKCAAAPPFCRCHPRGCATCVFQIPPTLSQVCHFEVTGGGVDNGDGDGGCVGPFLKQSNGAELFAANASCWAPASTRPPKQETCAPPPPLPPPQGGGAQKGDSFDTARDAAAAAVVKSTTAEEPEQQRQQQQEHQGRPRRQEQHVTAGSPPLFHLVFKASVGRCDRRWLHALAESLNLSHVSRDEPKASAAAGKGGGGSLKGPPQRCLVLSSCKPKASSPPPSSSSSPPSSTSSSSSASPPSLRALVPDEPPASPRACLFTLVGMVDGVSAELCSDSDDDGDGDDEDGSNDDGGSYGGGGSGAREVVKNKEVRGQRGVKSEHQHSSRHTPTATTAAVWTKRTASVVVEVKHRMRPSMATTTAAVKATATATTAAAEAGEEEGRQEGGGANKPGVGGGGPLSEAQRARMADNLKLARLRLQRSKEIALRRAAGQHLQQQQQQQQQQQGPQQQQQRPQQQQQQGPQQQQQRPQQQRQQQQQQQGPQHPQSSAAASNSAAEGDGATAAERWRKREVFATRSRRAQEEGKSPNLYDVIQLVCYCTMLGTKVGHLVEAFRTSPAATAATSVGTKKKEEKQKIERTREMRATLSSSPPPDSSSQSPSMSASSSLPAPPAPPPPPPAALFSGTAPQRSYSFGTPSTNLPNEQAEGKTQPEGREQEDKGVGQQDAAKDDEDDDEDDEEEVDDEEEKEEEEEEEEEEERGGEFTGHHGRSRGAGQSRRHGKSSSRPTKRQRRRFARRVQGEDCVERSVVEELKIHRIDLFPSKKKRTSGQCGHVSNSAHQVPHGAMWESVVVPRLYEVVGCVLGLRRDHELRKAWLLSSDEERWRRLHLACPFVVPEQHHSFRRCRSVSPQRRSANSEMVSSSSMSSPLLLPPPPSTEKMTVVDLTRDSTETHCIGDKDGKSGSSLGAPNAPRDPLCVASPELLSAPPSATSLVALWCPSCSGLLEAYHAPLAGFSCSGCGMRQCTGGHLLRGCRTCDFGLCGVCSAVTAAAFQS